MRTLIIILLVYLSVSAYLFFSQRSFIYFPTPKSHHLYPEEIYHFEEALVHVIVLNKGHENAMLYFGGNAEAVEHNATEFTKNFPNHTLYLVQYRGYGNSTGVPSETTLYSDALTIFDRLKTRHSDVSVIGRSLGSGIATLLASQREVKKLILITPYDSIEALAQPVFPLFPMFILLQDKYNSLERAKNIKTKTLLLVAENDRVINLSHSETLADAFNPLIARMIIIPNTGHNTISHSHLFYESIRQFIEESSEIPDRKKGNTLY